ncbi:uncharacterized protein LY89DRAFT_696299 [Mollisia scopiformis]|uniref:Uncharacterized protein n=1 Tax=Mollisia scopiformis TaxID=149040 RepID=A0A194XGH1_MOLSC|nr:uncharacterized protein LY89DRAFT_696299 [Mollisia scopiformis]KUJ18872.1 hypothetical protein LY89DRAFT_696299 [Mollisia scopiformis]
MATRPGEDLAATLFADVHYYYGPPNAKPPHHRFDKSSYIYLFENASQRRARIEVANNAGTPEQDAFNGYLDNAHVHYSYKHSTLVTVTVDGTGQPSAVQNTQEWHLPTFDPRNENKYMYRLHTVDLYFWAKEDAIVFVNGIRRVLPPQQITVQDEPTAPPPHQEEMSPVVQQLENIAISDPSYQQGRTRDSRTTSSSVSGPPISATPQGQEASNFASMAYNPAAPAAPEAIRHREKTPPPEDGAGNPLMAAATTDQGQAFGAPPYGQQGFSGPPGQPGPYFPSALSGPAPPSQFAQQQQTQPGPQSPFAQHFQNTFAPPPTADTRNAPYAQPPPSAPPAYQAHIPVTQQFAQYPGSPGLSSPGMNTPGIYSPGLTSPNAQFMPAQDPVPGISHSVTAPPGGFSQYNYQQTSNTKPLMTDYSIHQQVYRPTDTEAKGHSKGKELAPPRGKLEAGAGSLERSVTGLLKKLEKKIG